MQIIKNILKTIIILSVIIIIGTSSIIVIKANVNPDKIPDILGYKPMIVLSGSMETAIYTGDLVIVKMIDAEDVKNGDIIAFRNKNGTVTTHRIIEINNKSEKMLFRTKGDNNNTVDNELVDASNLEGVYQFRIPKLGDFLMFLKEPKVLIILLLAILVVGLLCLNIADKFEGKTNKVGGEKTNEEKEH